MGDDGHWRPPICSAVWNVGTPSPRPYWPDTTELALLDVRTRATWRWAGPTPSGRDLAYLALNLIGAGDASGGREALRQALRRANTEYVREDLIANAFMRLGDRESAIQWLVKGATSNVGGINFTLEDSLYAPIRSDLRIQAIIERLKAR